MARDSQRVFKDRDMSPFSAGDTSPLHTRWVRLSANLFGKSCWRMPLADRKSESTDLGTTAKPVPAATQAIMAW
jgi:hypothetical protein